MLLLAPVAIAKEVMEGVWASLSVVQLVRCMRASRKLRKRALQCLLLNVLAFIGSIVVQRHAIYPAVRFVVLGAMGGSQPEMAESVLWTTLWIVKLLCVTLWSTPLFVVCLFLNVLWCQDIADEAFAIRFDKVVSSLPPVDAARDAVYRLLLVATVAVQALVCLQLMGGAGWVMSVVLNCLAMSLGIYEYKWITVGQDLRSRLLSCERRWPFMVGFGLLATLPTYWMSFAVGWGFNAAMLPLLIVSSMYSDPPSTSSGIVHERTTLFRPSEWVVDKLLTRAITALNAQWLAQPRTRSPRDAHAKRS